MADCSNWYCPVSSCTLFRGLYELVVELQYDAQLQRWIQSPWEEEENEEK